MPDISRRQIRELAMEMHKTKCRAPVGLKGYQQIANRLSAIWKSDVPPWLIAKFASKATDPLPIGHISRMPFVNDLDLVAWAKRQIYYHPERLLQSEVTRKPIDWNSDISGRFVGPDMSTAHVYFIQSGESGPIKIGIAKNVQSRIAELQTSNAFRLTLLAVIEKGGYSLEQDLHVKFAQYRMLGEWFQPAAELISFIAGLEK